MRNHYSIRYIILIWAGWVTVLFIFQGLVGNRIELARPDKSSDWVMEETGVDQNKGRPYLLEPFLNTHVAWDSEYYLSIAVRGYDDPSTRTVIVPKNDPISISYAFMPLYPYVIRLLAYPLSVFNLNPIATATLAGVLISLLGTLAGMISLYFLASESLGEESGRRAAFYLLIFPSGFFLAQVYTEGLFIGLVFTSMVLMRRRRWLAAAVLAALAAWTRSLGALLVIPMVYNAFKQAWQGKFSDLYKPTAIYNGLMCLVPLLAYYTWYRSPLYLRFRLVEGAYFQRDIMLLTQSLQVWGDSFRQALHFHGQNSMYYLVELTIILISLAASVALLRKQPDIALFSLALIAISLFSGQAQSMVRYVIVCPVIFIALAQLGKRESFDRIWTITSILVMGLLATLFTFNFWVG